MDVFGGMVVLEANSQTAVMSVERAHRLDRVVAQRCKVRTDAEQRPQPRLHRQHPRCRQLHGNRTLVSGNVRIIRQDILRNLQPEPRGYMVSTKFWRQRRQCYWHPLLLSR